jgi:hypothetical protein
MTNSSAAVDVGGLAWLVSTTLSVVTRVGPQTATTVNWPIGSVTDNGVLKVPSLLATVLPTGTESIDS